MPRPRKLDRPSRVEIWLPESLMVRLRLELFSSVEQRIPHGAISNLGKELFTQWLDERKA